MAAFCDKQASIHEEVAKAEPSEIRKIEFGEMEI